MAELNVKNPGLVDILSRTDPDGKTSNIIELAEKSNPILKDAVFTECNDGTKHQHVIRTGIPEPAFRRYNAGVKQGKTTTAKVVDTTGMVEEFSVVDEALAKLNGNEAAFRASEMSGLIEGFNQFMARNMIYGSTAVTPDGFMGLDVRYDDPAVASGRQIINAGGTGSDNTSIWFVTWGPRATTLLYPKGSAAGLSHKDMGAQLWDAQDGSGKFRALVDHLKWDMGLSVGDWRGNARICNIDVSALTKDAATGADLLDLMIDAEEMIDTASRVGIDSKGNLVEGKTVIYVGRTVAKFLRKQALNKKNVQLRVEEVAGERVTMWGDMPVRRLDAISNAEAAITFPS